MGEEESTARTSGEVTSAFLERERDSPAMKKYLERRQSKFEAQIEYTTGWETIAILNVWDPQTAWSIFKREHRTMNVRLLRDGRRVR